MQQYPHKIYYKPTKHHHQSIVAACVKEAGLLAPATVSSLPLKQEQGLCTSIFVLSLLELQDISDSFAHAVWTPCCPASHACLTPSYAAECSVDFHPLSLGQEHGACWQALSACLPPCNRAFLTVERQVVSCLSVKFTKQMIMQGSFADGLVGSQSHDKEGLRLSGSVFHTEQALAS